MKPTAIMKIIVDIVMTVLLMLLMAFELVGRSAHEWIGLGMFLLFILHHALNRRWSRNLFRGRYTPVRILQTACAALVLLSMLGSLISAVPISRVVFSFLPISGGLSFGRTLHMLSAYWGFILLSFHLGLHWNMVHGTTPDEVRQDLEGMQTMRILGHNMAYFLKCREMGDKIGVPAPPQEPFVFTNFIH